MYNGVCCGKLDQRTFSDIQQAIKEEIQNEKLHTFFNPYRSGGGAPRAPPLVFSISFFL